MKYLEEIAKTYQVAWESSDWWDKKYIFFSIIEDQINANCL